MKKLIFIYFIVLFFLLNGCGSRDQREKALKSAIESAIKKDAKGFLELVSIKKNDGMDGELNGTKTYEMEFEITIKALKDCDSYYSGILENYFVINSGMANTFFTKGKKYLIVGKAFFIKKDKGWSLNDAIYGGVVLGSSHELP